MKNVTLPLGSISIIDKIEMEYGLISGIFGKTGGRTPLVHAFAEFHLYVARLLVSKGVKASVTYKYTCSPLKLMMKLGDKKMNKLLDDS